MTQKRSEQNQSVQKSDVLQAASQQHQLRQKNQLEKKSILCIQSFYRSYRSNQILLKKESKLLSSRLKDLITLSKIIETKTKTPYVPPPATASTLVLQLLFITRTIPYRKQQKVIII